MNNYGWAGYLFSVIVIVWMVMLMACREQTPYISDVTHSDNMNGECHCGIRDSFMLYHNLFKGSVHYCSINKSGELLVSSLPECISLSLV